MNQLKFILLILLILTTGCNIDEDLLKKNIRDITIQESMKRTRIAENISQSLNQISPSAMKDLKNTCEKSSGLRNIIGLIAILGVLGLSIPPIGIAILLFDVVLYLNYLCIFSI